MEAKYSPRVKDVITFSREEALRLKHDYIGTEHFLLGIIREGQGMAIKILKDLDVNIIELKNEIEKVLISSDLDINNLNNLPLTKQAEQALKASYLEGNIFKSDVIGTEHLLLSILKDEDTSATYALRKFGVNYDVFQKELLLFKSKTNPTAISNQTKPGTYFGESRISTTDYEWDFGAYMDDPLTLIFNTDEFSKDEIAQILSFLSEFYSSIGGDQLEIVGTNNLDFIRILEPVLD